MRTIGRLSGDMTIQDSSETQVTKAGLLSSTLAGASNAPDLLKHLDPETLRKAQQGDPDAVMAISRKLWTVDNKQGFPRSPTDITNGRKGNGKLVDGSPVSDESGNIRKTSKSYLQGAKGDMIQQPEGPTHRAWLRDVMDQAVVRLNKAGIPITHADLQAVMWFPEQRYWQQKLGVGTSKTDADYEDAATIMALNKGHEGAVRKVYEDQGFSKSEIDGKIDARRELAAKLAKEPQGDDDE